MICGFCSLGERQCAGSIREKHICVSKSAGNHNASSKGGAAGWFVLVDKKTLAYYTNPDEAICPACCWQQDPNPCCYYERLL